MRLTDGRVMFHDGVISRIDRNSASIEIRSSSMVDPPSYRVYIGIGFTKNHNRMEWCLEKLTELGVDSIIPILTELGERSRLRRDRLMKILVSAMKQSQRAYLPELQESQGLSTFLDNSRNFDGTKLIAHNIDVHQTITHNYTPGSNVLLLVGPEGGFSGNEIEQSRAAGFKPVILGTHRLRTETAAVTAVAAIHQLNLTQLQIL